MSSALCPHCDEPVTVPMGADPSAVVRCPLCKEEYELSAVLDAMPPSLIVVGGPAAEAGQIGDQRPGFLAMGAGAAEDSGEEFRLADEDGPRTSSFAFDSSAGDAGKAGVTATPRPKRKQKNPLLEVVKVAGGGIVGLSIAYIVLWWISPWFGKRPQDPVGVAPTLSRVVPWIVPAQLRGQVPSGDDGGGAGFNSAAAETSVAGVRRSGADAAGRQRPARPQPGLSGGLGQAAGGTSLGEEPPFGATEASGLGSAAPDPNDLPGTGGVGVTPPEIGVPAPDLGGAGLGGAGLGGAGLGGVGVEVPAIEPDLSALTPDADEALVADAPNVSAAMLAERLEAARTARQQWMEAEDEEKSAVAVSGYIVLSELGEAATFARRGQPMEPHRKAAAELVRAIAESPEQAKSLGGLGARWISSPSRRNRGVLLLGTVRQIQSEGAVHELRLALEGGKEPTEITVITRESPGEGLAEGSRLLVLGAIVTDPALNLTGYAGEEPLVVLHAAHSLVP